MTTILKLDYDDITFHDVSLIFHHRGWLLKRLGLVKFEVARSKEGYHVRAEVEKDLDPHFVILAQILLGSDINREIYNFLHHLDGEVVEQWNKLFTKKYVILSTGLRVIGKEEPRERLTQRLLDIIDNGVGSEKEETNSEGVS